MQAELGGHAEPVLADLTGGGQAEGRHQLARKACLPPQPSTELEQWAEGPLEHKQARDYRARIEAATNVELRAQYAPYAMPIAWHHVSDVVARPGSDVDQAHDAPPASP